LFSSAPWHSLSQGIAAPQTPQTHAVHYADANEPELAVNQQFLIRIESIFGPQRSYDLSLAVNILKDFIFQARKSNSDSRFLQSCSGFKASEKSVLLA
jgi:hypothetical protein